MESETVYCPNCRQFVDTLRDMMFHSCGAIYERLKPDPAPECEADDAYVVEGG